MYRQACTDAGLQFRVSIGLGFMVRDKVRVSVRDRVGVRVSDGVEVSTFNFLSRYSSPQARILPITVVMA